MKIVFDLDGTLANIEHRVHFLEQEPSDWRSFYAACDQDLPNIPIITIMKSLLYDLNAHDVEIWTGRSAEVREKTVDWLHQHLNLPYVSLPALKMRREGDHRPDTVLKKQWLDDAEIKPDLVFEDRESVVAMYRENGIVCCQVAEGKF